MPTSGSVHVNCRAFKDHGQANTQAQKSKSRSSPSEQQGAQGEAEEDQNLSEFLQSAAA
jgi:hypothetical protein